MKMAPVEMFRMLAIFFMVMLMINFSLLGYHINQANAFQNDVAEKIAKDGAVDKPALDYAKQVSEQKYRNMFKLSPAKPDYLPKRDINGKDMIAKDEIKGHAHPGQTVTIDYTQTQNYGRPIKYVISTNIPTFSFGGWSRLGSIHNTYSGIVVSQKAQHDLNREQEQY